MVWGRSLRPRHYKTFGQSNTIMKVEYIYICRTEYVYEL